MTPKQRVLAAINHREPDRIPKGDLAIEDGLLRAIVGNEKFEELDPWQRQLAAWRTLGADLVNVHQFPMQEVGRDDRGYPIFRSVLGDEHVMTPGSSQLVKPALADVAGAAAYTTPDVSQCRTEMLDWFRDNSDLFLFGQIGGPVSSLDWMLGTEDFLVWCVTHTDEITALAEKVMEFEVGRAKRFLDHGADAILIADDVAYNGGMFLPPRIMQRFVYPIWTDAVRRIKAHRNVPVLLHTDGDVRTALDPIVRCGFDGLQSLQPSAGMDIADVKQRYGDRLCLMGNLDLDRLMTFGTPAEVEAQVRLLCETIAPGGGFILSTCNILIDAIPAENALAMYRAAEEYGDYRKGLARHAG